MADIHRSSSRPWLPLAGVLLALLIAGAAGFSIVQSRQAKLAESGRELSNLAIAIAEQTDRAFQSVELVQASLIERFMAADVKSSADFARIASTPAIYGALKDKISGLPQVEALTIIDAEGKLIDFSRSWPIPDVNVSDRDYFKVLSTNAQLESYVSAPVLNRGTGTWTIYLARRVDGPKGQFLGLVLGAIRLETFEDFYASMALGPGSAISLLRQDGLLLARYPRVESMIGRSVLAMSPAARSVTLSSAVTLQQISPVDGKERLVSARALSSYPLIVVIGQDIETILASWRHTVIGFAAAAALIDLLIGVAVLLAMRQIKEQHLIGLLAQHAARHDPLTGLPNRLMLSEGLKRRLTEPDHFVLLCIDLDRFKAVNDSFGHPIGDDLLVGVAGRLQACVGPDDLVARTGGDEFAIVHAPPGLDDGAELAEAVLRTLRQPFDLKGITAQVGASIGLAVRPKDGGEIQELLRSADLALYRAKADGRNRWRRFEPLMAALVRNQRMLERDLARAVDRDEFVLHFQPVVTIATGVTMGFEALLRWSHAQLGPVSPSEFIPLAETTGLIVPIGEWVIREACREAATWPEPLTVAVNLSPAQLASGRVVETVSQALEATGMDPHRLELEITETALLHEDDAVLDALHKLRALGVRIALDDFGVGYSSLGYLTSFPFDRIKIDRSFVQKMRVSDSSRLVVFTILQLAKRLDVRTTGEGVETLEHLEALREEGCTEAQGFYFGRPGPAADVRRTFKAVVDAA